MRRDKLVEKIVDYMDMLKDEYPETKIILETVDGTVDCEIGDALIYEDPDYDIIIDAE